MFRKGQRVVIKPHKRTRTIFVNAEHNPGKTYSRKGGQTGTVSDIYDMGHELAYEVRLDPKYHRYGCEFSDLHSADELKAE